MDGEYPVRPSVDYPDRDLNRLTSAFRIFTVIPIAIVLGTIGGISAVNADVSIGARLPHLVTIAIAALGGGILLLLLSGGGLYAAVRRRG
jgi:hypothetical protein